MNINIEDSIRILQEVARAKGLFISSDQAEWILPHVDLEKMSDGEIYMIIENKLW